jgi:diguanylate cyclase (GGDEF)-like protein
VPGAFQIYGKVNIIVRRNVKDGLPMMMRIRNEKALPLLTSAAFAFMAGLMVLAAAVPFWLSRSMASVLRELQGDLSVQQSMVDVLGELRDAQSAQRGFIVTGNEAYLQPYLAAGQRLPPLLRAGQEQARSEEQRAVLRRIEQLAGLEMTDLDESIALRRAGDAADPDEDDVRNADVARGQPYMEELRRLVGAENARGQRQRDRRRDELLALSDRACLLSAAAAALAIAALGGLLLFVLRSSRARHERLRTLQGQVEALAGASARSDARGRELRLVADMLRGVAAAPSLREAGPAVVRCFEALLPGCPGAVFLLLDDAETPVRLAAWGGAAGPGRPGRPCIPLVTQDGLIGSLHLDDLPADPARRAEQEHLAQWAGEQLALALGHARERDTLRLQAVQDSLTGLFNRRYFDEAVNRELSRARRKALPTSLVVLDIDHFKRVNDTYGHGTGDNVLCAIARQISVAIREGDIACRYGGEELVILMPECPADVAADRAEELRAAIEACIPEAGGPGQVTASFGVAEYPTHGSDAESLFRAADRAMYRAKHQGRNQVVAAN